MPPTWQLKLAAVLASAIMLAIKMLISNGMEDYVLFAVNLTVAMFLGSTITAAIDRILERNQLEFSP